MHTEMKLSLLMCWEVAGYLLRRAVRLPDMCDKRVTTFFQLMQVIVTHSLEVAAKIRFFLL